MKKLNLKELELKLPKIDENYSKILIGGSYADDFGHQHDLLFPEIILDPKPVDYDGLHDQDGSNDGYADNGGYNEEQDGNNNNADGNADLISTFENNILAISMALNDGVNVEDMINNNHLEITMPTGMDTFLNQIENVLTSNSAIANYLHTLAERGVKISIGSSDTLGPDDYALTTVNNFDNGVIDIDFNESFFTANGYVNHDDIDNINLDHSNLNDLESLVATIAHEIFHAYLDAGFLTALDEAQTPQEQKDHMLANGYSEDEVAIFFTTTIDSNGIETTTMNSLSVIGEGQHDYMMTQDFTFVQDAITEFQIEQSNINQLHDGLQAAVEQAEQNLGSSTDPNINQQFQSTYENLFNQLQDFEQQFGWLIIP